MHFWEFFGQKSAFFGSKTVFLGQEVHYTWYILHKFTELILQICDYAQKRRIWRENCKYALDDNFHCHFCSRRKAAKFCHPVRFLNQPLVATCPEVVLVAIASPVCELVASRGHRVVMPSGLKTLTTSNIIISNRVVFKETLPKALWTQAATFHSSSNPDRIFYPKWFRIGNSIQQGFFRKPRRIGFFIRNGFG